MMLFLNLQINTQNKNIKSSHFLAVIHRYETMQNFYLNIFCVMLRLNFKIGRLLIFLQYINFGE